MQRCKRSGRGDPRGLVAVVGRIAPWGTHGQASETKSAVTQWEVRSRKWAQGRERGGPPLKERPAEAPDNSVLKDQPRNEDSSTARVGGGIQATLMSMLQIPMTSIATLLVLALTACSGQEEQTSALTQDPIPQAVSITEALSPEIGDGFVVWESNRTGQWRLWLRELDGSPARQLTFGDDPRLHCCPHISPDGRSIAYLDLAADQQGYPQGGAHGELRLVQPDGAEDRLLLAAVRNYYENRAVVWRSPEELVFIDPDQQTAALNLDSGEVTILTGTASELYPWLLDSQLRYAASGQVSFAPYDRASRHVLARSPLGGCQPYFTHDGVWGFWVAAPGGPIHKLELATGAIGTLLKKSDPRLLEDFGYLYFPMISRDGRALAWAASRNEHAHFEADYEVFLAPTDPATIDIVGRPVRITHHPATDRYPDVHLDPLELGLHRGEVPLTLHLSAPGDLQSVDWTWGDGAESRGKRAEHTFDRPGVFVISAMAEGTELAGRVIVEEPRPPRVASHRVSTTSDEVMLRFDEPIDIGAATWRLDSGLAVTSAEQLADGRQLLLHLQQPLVGLDNLVLEGVRDQSAGRHLMPRTSLQLVPAAWPANRSGLVLLWESGNASNLLVDEGRQVEEAVVLQAHGQARLDHDWALTPAGGYFTASKDLANRLRWSCQATNELTIEALIEPQAEPRGRGVILGMANGGRNFVLSQQGSSLLMSIRVKSRGPDAAPEVELMQLPSGRKSHVAITYAAGRLTGFLNGEEIYTTDEVQGGFFHWRSLPLTIGADVRGRSTWRGSLEALAIYNRVLAPEEIRDNAAHHERRLAGREAVPRWILRAWRSECSRVPTLEEIAPYREALVVCDYQVVETLEGDYRESSVRVARWAIQDGQRLDLPPGDGRATGRLVVERYLDNPQLESLYLSETLASKPGLPLMYLVGESWKR